MKYVSRQLPSCCQIFLQYVNKENIFSLANDKDSKNKKLMIYRYRFLETEIIFYSLILIWLCSGQERIPCFWALKYIKVCKFCNKHSVKISAFMVLYFQNTLILKALNLYEFFRHAFCFLLSCPLTPDKEKVANAWKITNVKISGWSCWYSSTKENLRLKKISITIHMRILYRPKENISSLCSKALLKHIRVNYSSPGILADG